MKALFVINPVAGGADHSKTISDLKAFTKQRGVKGEFLLTKGKGDTEKIKKQIEKINPDCVIAGGGDGTIRQVAEILVPHKIKMGILPMGSANGLATSLEIPKDPVDALEKIFESKKVKPMDMLRFNDKHFCIHVSDIGVNALLVKKYQESEERGLLGYAKYLLSSIQESSPLKIVLRTPDGIVTKESVMMAFANAHRYGTGVLIADGSVSDGRFEICNVERIQLDAAIKAGLTMLNVFGDTQLFSDVVRCTTAEIEVEPAVPFQIDGEYMGEVNHLKVEIVPGCIKLVA